MTFTFAALLAVLLGLIAAFHLYWAGGGSWGIGVVFPTKPGGPDPPYRDGLPAFSPWALATAGVAVLLVVAAFVPLAAVGAVEVPVPGGFVRFSIWALAVVFLLRAVGEFNYVGVFKRVRATPFAKWDTSLYTPLCFVLSVLSFGVALGSA